MLAGLLVTSVYQGVDAFLIETHRRVAFHVRMQENAAQLLVFPGLVLGHQHGEHFDQLGQGIDVLSRLVTVAHGDSDDYIGSHLPAYVDREVVLHSAVNKHLVAYLDRREHSRDCH